MAPWRPRVYFSIFSWKSDCMRKYSFLLVQYFVWLYSRQMMKNSVVVLQHGRLWSRNTLLKKFESRSGQAWPDLAGLVQTCPDRSRLGQTCPVAVQESIQDLSSGCPGIQDLSSSCPGRQVLPEKLFKKGRRRNFAEIPCLKFTKLHNPAHIFLDNPNNTIHYIDTGEAIEPE